MVDVAEGAGPVDRLHNLVLAMTGRIDDDGIDSVRELLGVGLPDTAAEYLTGCLVAGRIEVTRSEQHELRRVLDETRSAHSLADQLNVVESLPDDQHRFTAPDTDDTDLEPTLKAISARLPGLRGLWATHRITPAGNNYGAVPQGVLLAEVGPDGSSSAVALQLISALRRAGLRYAVEVFDTGTELPEYHREALANARRVRLEAPAGQRSAPQAAVRQDKRADHRQPDEPPPAPMLPVVEDSRPEGVPHAVAEPQREFLGQRTTQQAKPESGPAVSDEPSEHESEPEFAAERSAQHSATPKPAAEEAAEPTGVTMKVPAAVDAKLTDRERNLLRKLHEELAHREDDAPARRPEAVSEEPSWTSMPGGTGGFPPIAQH